MLTMKLRGRFAAAIGCLVLAVVAGAMASVYFRERRYLSENLRAECESSALRLAKVAEEALSASNDVLWLNYAKSWLETPGAQQAAVVDAQGRVYLHTSLIRGVSGSAGRLSTEGVAYDSLKSDVVIRRFERGGKRFEVAVPIDRLKKRFGSLVAVYDWEQLLARRDQVMAATAGRLAAVGAVALLLGLGLAWRLATTMVRPLVELAGAAEAVGAGDLSRRVAARGHDEVSELGRKFNAMSRRLQELSDAREKLMSAASHDMRSPLSILGNSLARTRLVLGKEASEDLSEDLAAMERALEELGRFVDDILDLARLQAGLGLSPARLELGKFLEQTRSYFARDASGYGLSLELAPEIVPRPVLADAQGLQRVLSNLILNAFKFTPQGGRIVLGAQAGPEAARVFVADTGPGIAAEDLPQLFSRFQKSRSGAKAVRRLPSSGLGLAICKEIVEAQGGTIWIERESGSGAKFVFTLPYA